MATIQLGNTAPIEPVKVDPNSTEVNRVPMGASEAITTFSVPDHIGVGQALTSVSSVFRSHHSDEAPAWVESDDEVLASALAREFDIPVGRPDGWGDGDKTADVPAISPVTATASGVDVNKAVNVDDSATSEGTA